MLVVHQSYLCDISRAFFYTVYMYHMCVNRILPPIIIITISQQHATNCTSQLVTYLPTFFFPIH